MSNQIVISSGAKVRSLEGVLTGSAGIVGSVPLGGANGVATLDSSGKVPLSQLPASVVTYLGTWNAATNTPTLTNGVGDVGDLYICNVAGTVNFGAGPITFAVGDWVIYNGSQWQKSAGSSGTVTSVAVSSTGNDAISITGSPITTAGTINIGFTGTSAQYVNGAGDLTTFPSLTGFVPYTGATADVNLGTTYGLSANNIVAKGAMYSDFGMILKSGLVNTIPGYLTISAQKISSNSQINLYSDTGFYFSLIAPNTANYSYTLPSANGTIALTSNLSSYVPYTGATSSVNLGTYALNAGAITSEAGYAFKILSAGIAFQNGYSVLSSVTGNISFSQAISAGNLKNFTFDFGAWATNTSYTYTLPAANGTIALTSNLSSYVPYTGATSAVDLGNYDLTVYGIKVGRGAGSISTNIVLGASALGSNTTGSINIAIGTSSLQANTTGSANTALGNVTLNSNLTGQNNTAIGNTALSMTTSSYNTGIGAGSLANNTSGSYNTGLGYGSGSSITTGSYNVIIGSYTGTSGMSNNIVLSDGQGNIRYQWDGTDNILTGRLKASSNILVEGGSILLKQGVATTSGSGYLSLSGSTGTGTGVIVIGLGNGANSSLAFPNGSNYSYTYPASTGTLVLGTGTTNYLPKFTGASTIGNSAIQDSGTLVTMTSPTDIVTGSGIGTSGATGLMRVVTAGTSTGIAIGQSNNTRYTAILPNEHIIYNDDFFMRTNGAFPLSLGTNNTSRLTITSAGNVGIGETPTSSIGWARILTLNGNNLGDTAYILKKVGSAQEIALGTDGAACYHDVAGAANAANNVHIFRTGGTNSSYSVTERMRITSGGAVLIGTTSQDSGAILTISQGTSVGTSYVSTGTGTTGVLYFKNANGVVGQVYISGSTTTYATSSDYRLKQDLKDYNGLSLINSIKTYDYEWKSDNTRAFGVLAHELQETLPYAVSGEKDDEMMQMVDYSKLVPVLVKAIQELSAKVTALENK